LTSLNSPNKALGHQILLILSDYSEKQITSIGKTFGNLNLQILQIPSIGIYQSMNVAVNKINTEYCLFINGGDEILNFEEISILCSRIQGHLWGYGASILYDENTQTSKKYTFYPYSKFLHKYSLKFVPHCSTIFNTDFLKNLGGYQYMFGIGSDQALIFNFATYGRPIITSKAISKFYLGGASTRSNKEVIENFKFIERSFRKNNNIFFRISSETIWKLVTLLRNLLK
jgi:hypothetical protein